MRVGFNPHKDIPQEPSKYVHQIIIPVYIPDFTGYFKDGLEILKLCVDSVLKTTHDKTFITVANNGSCEEVKDYLNDLLENNVIHEVIHSENIGKLNAILKGLSGNDIELVTICDADTMFLQGWQEETIKVFSRIPKAGVVGLVPQIRTFSLYCGNVVFDNFFSGKLRFLPIKNEAGFIKFYDSISWFTHTYHENLRKFQLGLDYGDLKVLVGTGHFAATYKKDIFTQIKTSLNFKLGGDSEIYLDELPLRKDYWRLTTYDNFAYHLGNVREEWMQEILENIQPVSTTVKSGFGKRKPVSAFTYVLKNKLFYRFIKVGWMYRMFLSWKKLPKANRAGYS
jgi:glycosyltransferase involved in cell wall biosynthesis